MLFLELIPRSKSLVTFQQEHRVHQDHSGCAQVRPCRPLATVVLALSQEAQTTTVCICFTNIVSLSAFGPLYSPLLLSAVCPAFSTADTFYPPSLKLSFLILKEAFHGNPFVATFKLNSPPRTCIPDDAKHGMLISLCQSLGGQP